MNKNFIISGFSDEVDSKIITQFEHLKSLGIKYFEPRFVDGVNIADLSDAEVATLKERMKEYGISVSSIGSPIGKISIFDDFEPHLEKLKRVIHIAKELSAKYIRIFSFFIPDGDFEGHKAEVMRRMKAMVAEAEKEGIMLLHENEKDIYGDIAPRCLEILKEVNSPNLRAVFDPANFVQCKQKTYPEGYELLKDYIEYMHIKDALEDGSVVPAGYGIGEVENILKALREKGWSGYLSLEPHLGSFEGIANLETDDKMEKLERSSAEKFTLAYESLMKIVERVEK